MNAPLFFATLDGKDVNMSSAYIMTQPFAKSVTVDRLGYNILLGRVVDEFITEAIKIPGLLPKDLPNEFPHTFRWPKIGEHADPNKVAKGREASLANGTASIPQFLRRGRSRLGRSADRPGQVAGNEHSGIPGGTAAENVRRRGRPRTGCRRPRTQPG